MSLSLYMSQGKPSSFLNRLSSTTQNSMKSRQYMPMFNLKAGSNTGQAPFWHLDLRVHSPYAVTSMSTA